MQRACIHRGGDDDYAWELATHPLPPALRPYVVKCYGYFERTAGLLVRNEVPISQVVVIIELGPPIEVGSSGPDQRGERFRGGFLAGLSDTYTITRYQGWQRGIEIFRKAPAAPLLRARRRVAQAAGSPGPFRATRRASQATL